MAIFKAIVHSEYAQIPNSTLQDESLSFEARGVLAMLLSMPNDWEVHKSWVVSQSKAGKDKVNSIFKELEDQGYIRKDKGQRKFGQFSSDDYFIFPTKPTVADLPQRFSRSGSAVNGESATTKETDKQKKHRENKHLDIVHSRKKITKSETWKRFYAEYPENRRGGSDATAWKKAKQMRLTEQDFMDMLNDVANRKRNDGQWIQGYVQGITKYIGEEIWKTPIRPLQNAQNGNLDLSAQGTHERINDTSW